MMDISVIIPVYNVEKYLNRLLNGIIAQTHANFEVILVNDGSTDRSGAICDQYALMDKRFQVAHQHNQGSGPARNTGLSMARGKYIYFCDPDDYLDRELLKETFEMAEKHRANMVIFGYYDEVHTVKGIKAKPMNAPDAFLETKADFRNSFGDLHTKNIMFTLWNKLYLREFLVVNHCRFDNQKVGQDTLFNYKVYEELDRVYVSDKLYYHYVISRPDSAINHYREDRFQMRYNGSLKLEKLIENWAFTNQYEHVIFNDWYKTLYVGMNNLFFAKCPLSMRQKVKQIALFVQNPKIEYFLKKSSLQQAKSPFMAMLILLLKKRRIRMAFLLMKVKKTAERLAI